jgi:GT2 family glycosyltransferase
VAAAGERRIVSLTDPAGLDGMTPGDRLRFCAFDNVCSCIRREVWRRHPFQPTTIAEDLQWAREVLIAGHRLAYVPDAVVMHSHERSALDEFSRTRLLHRRLFELFELRTIPGIPDLMLAVAASAILHLRLELKNPARLPRALALAAAWPLGQYLGARAGAGRQGLVAQGLR